MTERQIESNENQSPAEAFLRATVRRQSQAETAQVAPLPAGDLAEALPADRPRREAFVRQVMEELQTSSRFTALVMAVDTDHADGESGDPPSCLPAVCQSLEEFSMQIPVLWGVVENRQLACFLPDADSSAGHRLAEQVKNSLADRCAQTVTVGIADFPCLDFSKDQVLENARKALDHARFFGPDSLVVLDAISLNISADRLFDAGDVDGAIAEFKRAVQLDPDDANIRNSLGVCYGVAGNLPHALDEFTAAIDLDASEPLALYNAGLVSKMTGNRKEALEYFLRADRRPGERYEIALQIGRLYLDMEIPDSARPHLERAAGANPDSAPALAALGDCYSALQLPDEAIRTYKKALRRNANDAASLSGLGWLYHTMGKNHEIALLFCRQSVDIAPANGLYRQRLGDLLLQENNLQQALQQYRKAAELGWDASTDIAEVQSRLSRES